MTNTAISQSQKRFQESLGQQFADPSGKKSFVFLKSSSDAGVIRNGGRNGARFAPQSFLSTFKKFSSKETLSDYAFYVFEVADPEEELADFHAAQMKEAQRISENLKAFPNARICHIGGGHDHVYPLLKALSETYKKIIVINIDAHADTRTDEQFHSGTPFRQFAKDFSGEFEIFQLGLHPFANSLSTISPLPKGKSVSVWRNELSASKLDEVFSAIKGSIREETCVVFSLDADALAGHEVPGVSAVNPYGLTSSELRDIWKRYVSLPLKHQPVMGIYELNPLYDSLASISMRTLGSFVFESL